MHMGVSEDVGERRLLKDRVQEVALVVDVTPTDAPSWAFSKVNYNGREMHDSIALRGS